MKRAFQKEVFFLSVWKCVSVMSLCVYERILFIFISFYVNIYFMWKRVLPTYQLIVEKRKQVCYSLPVS